MTADQRKFECAEAVEHLYSYLDEDLTAEVRAAVKAHLKECPDCFGQFEFERAFLRFVEARTRAHEAPPAPKKKIFEQILLDRQSEA